MSEQKKPRTFHISTYGCQMNLADSSTLAAALAARGYRRVPREDDADLIILNTCSVRQKAEERVFGRLAELQGLKTGNGNRKIAVVGCMAQRLGAALIEKLPHVDYVLGTDREFELPDVIEGVEGTSRVMTAFGHENMDVIEPVKETPYSGFVTISRGCDNHCSYCIVPYVRGEERAHGADYITSAVREMVDEGVVEVTLLGQNVNSYRYGHLDFSGLLRRVLGETGIERLRFMTSHPRDLSPELVDVMADEPRLMPHVHLPLQSGNDRILEKMGRRYSVARYREIIEYIRAKLDYAAITTDLIVGFPTESDDEYEDTLAAVREFQFDTAFMFRYSPRPGTEASGFPDDVAEPVKISRLNRLIALQQAMSRQVNQREIGRVRHSLVEGYSRRSRDYLRARTEGNKTVLFKTVAVPEGTVLPVRITAADAFTLHGEIVERQ
ncbi:MAG TPA: tRNA (N6-isopentenyl adenosine(37)-C2)-methylthiotransferase MiaB [Acidobacteriota bacterium]|nr:tRNA (N6-isopentenyl adenosine(37)-C2)-methylthiotransferase MiaB [Acidobacteriota bacterium]